MKTIILAGGKGTRLSKKSAINIPKALVKINNKPIIQHQIDMLESQGLSDIKFALGFRAGQIVDYLDGKYEHVIEKEPLGTGGAIKFASRNLDKPFMVINGDIIGNVNLKNFIVNSNKDTNTLLTCHHKNNTDFGFLKIDKNDKIIKFMEKPNVPTSGYVSVGFYILQPNIFDDIDKNAFSIEYDIFPKLVKQGSLHSFEHTGFWTDLGTEERINLMQQL